MQNTESFDDAMVAPITGAWIETLVIAPGVTKIPSHPSRVRGLKPLKMRNHLLVTFVAPITGAWIETYYLETGQEAR